MTTLYQTLRIRSEIDDSFSTYGGKDYFVVLLRCTPTDNPEPGYWKYYFDIGKDAGLFPKGDPLWEECATAVFQWYDGAWHIDLTTYRIDPGKHRMINGYKVYNVLKDKDWATKKVLSLLRNERYDGRVKFRFHPESRGEFPFAMRQA